MSWLSAGLDWLTGADKVGEQKDMLGYAGQNAQTGLMGVVDAYKTAWDQQQPYWQKVLSQLITDAQTKEGNLRTSSEAANRTLQDTTGQAIAGGQAAAAQKEGLVREGMGMDRGTLTDLIAKANASQRPYAQSNEAMLAAVAPQLMAQMGLVPGGQVLLSPLAKLQQEQAATKLRATMQRQGLEGSPMLAQQQIGANNQISAEDFQRTLSNLMAMYQGAQSTGQALGASSGERLYGSTLASLGSRLNNVNPFDPSQMIAGMGQRQAANTGALGAAINQTLPDVAGYWGDYGKMLGANTLDRANAMNAVYQNSANVQRGQAGITSPSPLQTLTGLVQAYGAFSGLGGGSGFSGLSNLGRKAYSGVAGLVNGTTGQFSNWQ